MNDRLTQELLEQDAPKHYKIAKTYLNIREIPGRMNNETIVGFFKTVLGYGMSDETAWCAIFVGHCIEMSGLVGTGKALARSFLSWGKKTLRPKIGDVVIFWRESPESWKGHVAFYAGETVDKVLVLGGNQDNMVCYKYYKKSQVLDYRTEGYLDGKVV